MFESKLESLSIAVDKIDNNNLIFEFWVCFIMDFDYVRLVDL